LWRRHHSLLPTGPTTRAGPRTSWDGARWHAGLWQAGRVVKPDRPEVPTRFVRRIGELLAALPECREEEAWVGTRWLVPAGSASKSTRTSWATVAHVFGGEDQLFRVTFRAEPDEVIALQHLGPPYFRARWGRNVVGLLVDDDTDWEELGELLADSYCVQASRELADQVSRPTGPGA
jgi:hypothetical protein